MKEIRNKIRSISDKKKGSLFIVLTGLGALLIGLFAPFTILNLILGILILLIGINYNRTKKGKKRRHFALIVCIFLGVSLIGSFLFFYVQPSSSGTLDGNTFTHRQEDIVLNGQIYNFQHDLINQYGEVITEGELRVPTMSFIVHYAVTRAGGLIYELKFFTSIKLLDDQITLLVLIGNNTKPSVATQFIEKQYNLTTSSTLYDYELEDGIINIDGSLNVEFYFFQLRGQIDPNQPANFSAISSLELSPSYTNPDDLFGYSEMEIPSLADVLDDIWSRDVFFMLFFILFFLTIFLIMWVTGQLNKVKYPLTILLMTGLLILFVEIILSPELPIIKEAIAILGALNMGGLVALFLLIGMAIAVVVWSITVGSALAFCMILYYFWNQVLGSFVGDSLD
jgi:hypothetical protein